MAQFEQPAAQAVPKTAATVAQDGNTPRSGMLPLVGVIAAAAFVANAFFFYHQGQRDATNPSSEAPPVSAPASAPTPSDETGTPSRTKQLPAETAMASTDSADPATNDASAASPGKPDIVMVVHPSAQTKANAASQRLTAKATKAAAPLNRGPSERQVALIAHPNPAYPVQALRAGEQGTVLVLAQVDVNGQVTDAQVVRHSGSFTLDRAATNEVRRWKFEPALHDGRPAVASVEVPVSYRLGQ
jgi:TonB family protein